MVLVNSGVHTRMNLSENYPQLGYAPSKLFVSPVLDRKNFKNISSMGRRIIKLLGAHMSLTYSGHDYQFNSDMVPGYRTRRKS